MNITNIMKLDNETIDALNENVKEKTGSKITKSMVDNVNALCKSLNMPQLIVENGYVYRDELHKALGLGIKLDDEETN